MRPILWHSELSSHLSHVGLMAWNLALHFWSSFLVMHLEGITWWLRTWASAIHTADQDGVPVSWYWNQAVVTIEGVNQQTEDSCLSSFIHSIEWMYSFNWIHTYINKYIILNNNKIPVSSEALWPIVWECLSKSIDIKHYLLLE